MSEFISRSQAGQDQFVWELTEHKTDGTFLDLGSGDPIVISNTYALEQQGWRGLLVDVEAPVNLVQPFRASRFIRGDASKIDWNVWPAGMVDYLSLDCNGGTLHTLKHLPFTRFTFRIITIEHDKYRFGPAIQDDMIDILSRAGYDLLCKDVLITGAPFEDWWIMRNTVNMELAEKCRCNGLEWSEILKRL